MATELSEETIFVNPETTLKEPKRRGRPRKVLDAITSDGVEDSATVTPEPKKERKPRKKPRQSHEEEIEGLLGGMFQLAAVRLGPVIEVPSPLWDDETQRKEKESLHRAAVYFDKWQMGLSDDSPFVKYLNKVADVSPLVIAVGSLGQIVMLKYQLMGQLAQAMAHAQNAQNGYQ